MASPRGAEGVSPLASTEASNTPVSIETPSTPVSAPAALSDLHDQNRSSARRGKITQIACVACRQRKSKCDGARPICQACKQRPGKCVYDVTLDQRKPSSLRQRVGELETDIVHFRDIIELLLNALPERLKPRFQGFAQDVLGGVVSNELLDDAKERLRKPVTPGGNERVAKMVVQDTDNSSTKFSLSSGEMTGHSQDSSPQNNDSYFFDYAPNMEDQSSEVNMVGTDYNMGLAMPMPVDSSGMGTGYWQLQGLQMPSQHTQWNPQSGEEQQRGQSTVQPMQSSDHQTNAQNWCLSAGNQMRALQLYGKLEVSNSAGQPIELNTTIPIYLVHPLNEDDRRPLSGMYSGVYSGYRDSKRQLIRDGANPADILGSPQLNFQAAIEPSHFHNDLQLSTWATELFGAHRNLRSSDRVACAWLVTSLMRWQIVPTREHYEQIPTWLRPTPTQCFVPHAANIDYLPWPSIRDALAQMEQENAEVTVNALSVNWPYPDGDILYLDQATNTLALSPAFLSHVSSLNSWTLSGSVLRTVPSLNGLARFDNDR